MKRLSDKNLKSQCCTTKWFCWAVHKGWVDVHPILSDFPFLFYRWGNCKSVFTVTAVKILELMLQLRSECHTVWCWVQLPGHSSIPVDAAEGTMQHSTLRTDTNGWTQMTCRYHPTSMRCAPSAQSVWQLLTAMDSLKSQLHPLLSRSTYWPHHLWWAEWDRSKKPATPSALKVYILTTSSLMSRMGQI